MTSKTDVLENIPANRALKLNVKGAGNYRVEYDEPSWILLLQALPKLGVEDRVNLLSDAWALVQADHAPVSLYFELVEKLPPSTEIAEREQIINVLDFINGLLVGDPSAKNFNATLGRSCVQRLTRSAGNRKRMNRPRPQTCARV